MAVISKDLGAVTAYAAAVNRGYTGTKEEFETLMASYATVAEQAAESAQSAGQSATNASQSAQTAETAKGTAQQAATDAQTAQASAQESAQSAQQSAQSASQSAQTAESAKETAVDAVDGFAAGAQQALDSVNQAGVNWKSLAQAKALDSEAYALGTRDGEDVGSSDPAYHNNAKYYAESVSSSAQTATEAAQTATTKASEAAQSASAAAESARTLTIDRTLTQAGQAADSKVVGDKINNTDSILHSARSKIVGKQYKAIKIENGKIVTADNPSGYWKHLIVPIENLFLNGVAKLTANYLQGNESQFIPAMAFCDEDYNVVGTPVYSAQHSPKSFQKADVPDGACYACCSGSTFFEFEFASTDELLSETLSVKNATTIPSGVSIALTFEPATGYYNASGGFSTFDGVTSASVAVTPKEQYLLTSRNYYNAALAVFFKQDGSFLSSVYIANNTKQQRDVLVVVPDNAVSMVIQRIYNYVPTSLVKVTGISIKPVKSILNGKNVTLIGDSITEKNSTANTNWALWMYDWCGANVQNLGASGTGFIAGNTNPYHNRISRISNPDIIGIALSFNDMSQSIEDLTTAAETFFDDLITAYPATPIICYVQSPWSAYHPGVEKSDQWIAALRNVCVTRGVPFYDEMYYGSALRPWLSGNRSVYYMHDGEGSDGAEDWVHPNSEGHKVIARHLYPLFEKNVVTTGLSCVIGD